MRLRFVFILLSFAFVSSSFYTTKNSWEESYEPKKIPYLKTSSNWANSLLLTMTLEEKIGQLFNVAAYSNEKINKEEVEKLINDYHVGGLTFFQGGISKQLELTNHYQTISKIPLMVAMDAEWGMAMRIDSVVKYPWQMTLGAIQDNALIYQMGKDIAKQMHRIGVNVSFSPVVDVNNNPDNPIINARSFGEDRKNVAQKGIAYMQGLQDGKVLACAKHFPGHGDTDSDSHKTLPLIDKTKKQMDSLEIYPFKQLIKKGVGSIMVAHLNIPAYSESVNYPSSLNPELVTNVLRNELGFNGLTFTDGLNMRGVSDNLTSEEVDLKAIMAGNDILLLSRDVGKGVAAIQQAILDSTLSLEILDAKILKILKAKYWMGLNNYQNQPVKNLYTDLNQSSYQALNRRLTESSITLLKNEDIIPLKIGQQKIAVLSIGEKNTSTFQKAIGSYAKANFFNVETDLLVSDQKAMMDTLMNYDIIIVGVHRSDKHPWVKYDISDDLKGFINVLRLKKKVILDVFANPYSLRNFLAIDYVDGLIMSYQNSDFAQQVSAEIIFGASAAKGKLPVGISQMYPYEFGLKNETTSILNRKIPEEIGINGSVLDRIDTIALNGIKEGAYPGCQILVAKSGHIIYDKSFGKHTYEGTQMVEPSDLYDIASVTKISATLLAVMDLVSKDQLSLDDNLGKHLGKLVKGTDYAPLKLRDILAHQAGLAAWIPFYVKTMQKGVLRADLYDTVPSDKFSVRVANNIYITKSYEDTIFYRIVHRAKVNEVKEYKYSDVGYYFMKAIVEKITNMPIENYLQQNFYGPMGMSKTMFNPRFNIPLTQIVPTEDDKIYRKQLIWGDVHDPGAAMLGGVGGHAGLFTTSNDLAKLMQMYMSFGSYGGKQYIKSSVIREFTKCQFCKGDFPANKDENRRGAGFDKPQFRGEVGPTCDCVSYASFGHSGFTGTYAWADPDNGIVYIFLSNRVYPDANNKKLVSMGIRTNIQAVIYDAVASSKKTVIN